MIKRCIMIFPELTNIEAVNEIRRKYDPLANHVEPHITLVFPFDSLISTYELKHHLISSLSTMQPFLIKLHGIVTGQPGNYLFLNLIIGIDEIVGLHNRMYMGMLEPYKPGWHSNRHFMPHMTVGKFTSDQELDHAFEQTKGMDITFEATVNKISVENIDENEDSIIEMEITI